MKEDKKSDRPASYPRPSETDNQLNSQEEFVGEQPNKKDEQVEVKVKVKERERERESGRDRGVL